MSILFSEKCQKINQISPLEDDFTEVLGSIAVMPKMLYFYGKMPKNVVKMNYGARNSGGLSRDERRKTIAIVGSRKPTNYGKEITFSLAMEIARRGGVVVSGLAYGIDAMAHKGAVEAGGVTVAVLGTPIDKIYPRGNQALAEQILDLDGCIMSELAPNADFVPKTSFLERNRIISGLADVVVVTEAAERSGSLNTAAHALEQGKEVFAVPGDINRPTSKGCNRLIRQGATPFLEIRDVIDYLWPPSKKKCGKVLRGDNSLETAVLQVIAGGVQEGEKIMIETGFSVSEFNQIITVLEIKGRVKSLGLNRWILT